MSYRAAMPLRWLQEPSPYDPLDNDVTAASKTDRVRLLDVLGVPFELDLAPLHLRSNGDDSKGARDRDMRLKHDD